MAYIIRDNKLIANNIQSYDALVDKPTINDHELLRGNHTSEELGILWTGTQAAYDALPIKNPNTIYVVTDGDSAVAVSSYLDLANLPEINNVKLTGNKSLQSLNLYSIDEVDALLASARSLLVVTQAQWNEILADPTGKGRPNTMYYVQTDTVGVYHVYLMDMNSTINDMGLSNVDFEKYQEKQPQSPDPANPGSMINDIKVGDGTVVGGINTLNDKKMPRETEFKTVTLEDLRAGGSCEYDAVKFSNGSDSPNGSTTNSFVVTVRRHNANYCSITARFSPSNQVWECSYNNGTWNKWQITSPTFREGNDVLNNKSTSSMQKHLYYTFGDLSSSNRRGFMKIFELPYLASYHDFKVNIKLSSSFASNGLNGEMELYIRRGSTSGIATDFNVTSRIITACDSLYGAEAPYIFIYKSTTDYRMHFYLVTDGQYYRRAVDISYDFVHNNTAGGGNCYEPVVTDDCGVFTTTTPTTYSVNQMISFVKYKPTITTTSSSKATVTCDAYRIPGSNFYTVFLQVTMTQASGGNVAVINLLPVQFFETAGATAGGKVAGISLDASGNVAVHGSNIAVGDSYRAMMTIPCRTKY